MSSQCGTVTIVYAWRRAMGHCAEKARRPTFPIYILRRDSSQNLKNRSKHINFIVNTIEVEGDVQFILRHKNLSLFLLQFTISLDILMNKELCHQCGHSVISILEILLRCLAAGIA